MSNTANGQFPKIFEGMGDKNTPINQMMDAADNMIAGAYVGANAISLTGLGASTLVLSEAQAQARFLEFSGTLSAAATVSIDVTAGKSKAREWMIFNNTSGAFALNIKLSNSGTRFGTGVAPTQGKKAYFYHTNFNGGANGDIIKSTADF
jgi:hypothetical protein